jgi:hypothetical protein
MLMTEMAIRIISHYCNARIYWSAEHIVSRNIRVPLTAVQLGRVARASSQEDNPAPSDEVTVVVVVNRESSVNGGLKRRKEASRGRGTPRAPRAVLLRHRCRSGWPRFALTHFSRGS